MQQLWTQTIKPVGVYLLTFQWVTGLLSWSLTSAGTVSEAVFVLAPLWICIDASVHPFVRLFLSEAITENISYFADTLLVGIPELIALSAIVTVIFRIGVWSYQGKKIDITGIWVLTFGIPTFIFIVITVLTLWYSLANVAFQLPIWAVQIRGIAAYWYGISSLLYIRLGKPQEINRLKQKDDQVGQLTEQNRLSNKQMGVLNEHIKIIESTLEKHRITIVQLTKDLDEKTTQTTLLTRDLDEKTREINTLNGQLSETKNHQRRLIEELQIAEENALQGYSEDCQTWLKSGITSASVDDISRYTGHKKAKIVAAKLRKAPRNPSLILISSLVEWLERTPAPERKTETDLPVLRMVKA